MCLNCSFPSNHKKARVWERAVRRKNWKSSKHSKLCSLHFKESDYQVRPGTLKPYLKIDAVPSIFNFPEGIQQKLAKRNRKIELLQNIVALTAKKKAEDDEALKLNMVQDIQNRNVEEVNDIDGSVIFKNQHVYLEDDTNNIEQVHETALCNIDSSKEMLLKKVIEMQTNLNHCYWEIDLLKSLVASLVKRLKEQNESLINR